MMHKAKGATIKFGAIDQDEANHVTKKANLAMDLAGFVMIEKKFMIGFGKIGGEQGKKN